MKVNKTEQVNNKGIKKMSENKKIVTMADEVKNAVKKLFARAEREVPENMTFTPVKETFKNVEKNYESKEFTLKIIADPVDVKKSRRLLLSAYLPNSDYAANITVTKGTKSELLKEINEDGFYNKIIGLLKKVDDAANHAG